VSVEILVLGINHKTAPVEIREKLVVPVNKTPEFLDCLKRRNIFDERVVLSTCNRTEIYGAAKTLSEDIRQTKAFLSEYFSLDVGLFEDKLYLLKQPNSVEHLFSVTSGLDSMVVGETEIIGQVKDAYLLAHQQGQTGKVLNTLFQRSLKVAKSLRSGTQIGMGRVSVASVTVELSQKIFEDLKNVRVMVLGTGEMATQVVKALVSSGAYPVIVSSRHHDRAEELAKMLNGQALRYQEYEARINEADILIASTHARRFLVGAPQVKRWMKIRHEKPLFLIDIAVPRNIDPEVEKLDNVYLYNIDDLKGISDKNLSLRHSQVERCEELVRGQTKFFMNWLFKEFGAPC
jgi:glutamyl-tRNA reductase